MYAEVIFMADYKAMYYKLFNKVSDVICDLQEIQQICEEMYIESEEEQAFVPAMDINLISVEMVIGRISAQGTEEFLQHTPKEMQIFWQRYLEMIASNPSDDILVKDLS